MDDVLRSAIRVVREDPAMFEVFLDALFGMLDLKGKVSIKEQVDARVKRDLQEAQKGCAHSNKRPKMYRGTATGLMECPKCMSTWNPAPPRCTFLANSGYQCAKRQGHEEECAS